MKACVLSKKKKSKDLESKKFYTLDIETNPKTDAFKLACINAFSYKNESFEHYTNTYFDEQAMFEVMIQNIMAREVPVRMVKKKEVKTKIYDLYFVFNIKFDSRFIKNELIKRKFKFTPIASSQSELALIIQIDEYRYIKIKDFCVFAKSSLHSIAQTLKTPTQKYPPEVDFSDYLQATHFFNTCSMEDLEKHCQNDTKMTSEAVFLFRKLIFKLVSVDFLSDRIYSLASLAMKIFQTEMSDDIENCYITYDDKNKKQINSDQYDFVKSSYIGGWVENFDNRKYLHAIMFDRNSAYPYAGTMLKMGIGKPVWTDDFEYFKRFTKTEQICGFVCCDIDFNASNCILPFTVKKNKEFKLERSTHPLFNKIITSIEFWYLKEKGVPVIFKKALVFEKFDESYSLSNFFTKMYAIKSNESLGKDINYCAKIIANALSGKFGQKIEQQSSDFFISDNDDPILEEKDRNKDIHIHKKESDRYVCEIITPSISLKNFMFIHWISAITAYQRCGMSEMIFYIHKNHVLYCDTDSIVLKPTFTMPTSRLIGEWKIEHTFIEFRAIAKKLYAYSEMKDGILRKEVKAKGLTIEQKLDDCYEKIMNWREGETISFKKVQKVISFKQSLIRVKDVEFSDYCTGVYDEEKTLSPSGIIKMPHIKKPLKIKRHSNRIEKPPNLSFQYMVIRKKLDKNGFEWMDLDKYELNKNLYIEENYETVIEKMNDHRYDSRY